MPNVFENQQRPTAPTFDASAIFNEALSTGASSLRQVILAHADMDGLTEAISLSHADTYGMVDQTSKTRPDYMFGDPE